MPFYDYACLKCNHELELKKSINDPHHEICPKCGFDSLIQVHKNAPNFELKGKGWFKNGGQY